MKKIGARIIAAIVLLTNALSVAACDWCRIQVKKSVYAENFVFNFLLLLIPVAVLITIGIVIYFKNEIVERIGRKK